MEPKPSGRLMRRTDIEIAQVLADVCAPRYRIIEALAA
jgi:hypothetical protein